VAVQTPKSPKPTEPTFNDKIQAILEKATAVKIDSDLVARQDTTNFEPLTLEEESLLNGLRPMNATLMAIQADTATKKAETVAAIEVKPDGECKTCFAVDSEDSTTQKSKLIALKTSRKAVKNTRSENEAWNSNSEINSVKPDSEAQTDSLFSGAETETLAPEKPEAITAGQEQSPESEENQLAHSEKNENSLVIPADEVKKLRESLPPVKQNAMDLQEKTAGAAPENPALTEPLPLNKSLAGEKQP
jgi:hypothetical protein